jgi:putative ABC transport system permease protein
MLRAQWFKVINDLWGNKTRTILIVLSIAVGVFSIGMIAGSRVILSHDMMASYLAVNPTHATLYTDPFDNDFVQAVRRIKGVHEAEGRRSVTVRLQTGSNEWRNIQLFAIPDYADMRINIVTPVRGDWPPPDHELLLERASVSIAQANVGDTLVVETPDGKQHRMRVAGLAYDFNQRPAAFLGKAYGYITFDTLEWLGESRTMDTLNIIIAEQPADKAHIQQVVNRVSDLVEKSGRKVNSVYIPTPGKYMADDFIQSLLLLLGVLGLLSLAASGFLIINMISALLAQQTRQIGIMKAIGARTDQVVVMYLSLVLCYSLLALAIAVPLGGLGAVAFSRVMASQINFDIKTEQIPLQVLALEITVGLVVPLLAALYPIVAGMRVTVREAINNYGLAQASIGKSYLDQLIERVSGLSRPLLISLRNTFRRKGRLALTLLALILGGAIFIAVLSVRASLARTLDEATEYWNYDISISFNYSYRTEEIERNALAVPGVVKVECRDMSSTRRVRPDGNESSTIPVEPLPAETSVIRPTILQGRWLLPDDKGKVVVNTDLLRDETDIRVGDELVLKFRDRKTVWQVVGIVKSILSGPGIYVNDADFASIAHDLKRANTARIVTERHDAASRAQVAEALEKNLAHAGMGVSSTDTINAMIARVEKEFTFLIGSLLAIAVMLAASGGIGLMGTVSLNVLERTREVGVLRTIGASDGAVLRIVMAESLFVGVLSWLMSLIPALPLSKILSDVIGVTAIHNPLTYVFSIRDTLLWLVIAVLLAGLASYVPARRASQLSVREVLAYE